MRILAGAAIGLRRIADIALIALILTVMGAVALGKLVPLTGRQSIVIGGASMEPAIHVGAAVVITPVDPKALDVGDVVSLQVGEARTTFTHRIVDIVDREDGRWIRTKGDANAEPDPTLVPATAVLGRVDLAIPLMGYLIVLMSAPVGVLFVFGIGATLLAIAWLLESLEPAPPVARRSPSPRRVEAGEPIAARPSTTVGALAAGWPVLAPSGGSAAAQLVAPRSRTLLAPDPASAPRPTSVREHLERSRRLRLRRARWQVHQRGGGAPG
jgi:signal peptidase